MLLCLSALSQIHNHLFDVSLSKLTLLLLARLRFVAIGPGRVAPICSGWSFTDSAVIALRLDRLRDLQHVTQALVIDDCG
ncbi:hypothetical protein WM15_27900, partial [Burkholderia ubonensis]